MGLTAIPSSEVLDIMSRDFYEKYEEYMSVVEQRKDRSRGLQTYSTAVTVERHQLANFLEKAVQDTSAWNKRMNMERYVILKKILFSVRSAILHQLKLTNISVTIFRIHY